MTDGRVQYDGDELDEIVLTGVDFHIERMSHHGWWMAVRAPDGSCMDFWWAATGEIHMEESHSGEGPSWPNVERINCEPLTYACKTTWTDLHGGEHQCEIGEFIAGPDPSGHRAHRCECGAKKRATP